jgi:nucleotide-binding universal stress UspA family protein
MTGKGIRTVLVAVDGSAQSHRVVKKGLKMAVCFSAKIILLHVRQKVSDLLGEPYYEQVLFKYIRQAEEAVEPLKKMVKDAGVRHEVLILEGDPAEAIITAAEDEKCDLIVMGTRGLSNLKSIALGSVSHKVLQSSECMVLIVP